MKRLDTARLKLSMKAVRMAGKLLVTEKPKSQIIVKDSAHDFSIEMDRRIHDLVCEFLMTEDPESSIFSEEDNTVKHNGHGVWILDPLDGTVNYSHNLPFCAVSLAYAKPCFTDQNSGPVVYVEGLPYEVQCSAIYLPNTEEMISAGLGCGYSWNGLPGSSIGDRLLRESIFGVSLGSTPQSIEAVCGFLQQMGSSLRKIRILGATAADLALIATGRLDGIWHPRIRVWDIAAGLLAITEAGFAYRLFNPTEKECGILVARPGAIRSLEDTIEGVIDAQQAICYHS